MSRPSPARRSALAACLLACGAWSSGCGGYGEVSPLGYDYAMALYSICNRKSSEELAPLRAQIEQSRSQQELSEKHALWLTDIIDDAEGGDWESARSDARRLMEDQVQGR